MVHKLFNWQPDIIESFHEKSYFLFPLVSSKSKMFALPKSLHNSVEALVFKFQCKRTFFFPFASKFGPMWFRFCVNKTLHRVIWLFLQSVLSDYSFHAAQVTNGCFLQKVKKSADGNFPVVNIGRSFTARQNRFK